MTRVANLGGDIAIWSGWSATANPVDDFLWWYWGLFFTFLGLLFGSFFNVCIYRIPVMKSIVTPGSHCYSCGTFLKAYENIPVLSYLLQRGCCRSCGSRFSPRYALVEAATGVMFGLIYWRFGPTWPMMLHLVFASLLLIGVFTDFDHFILPDRVTIGGAAFGIAATAIMGRWSQASGDFALSRDLWNSLSSFVIIAPSRAAEVPAWAPLAWSVTGAIFGYGMLWAIAFLGRLALGKEAMGQGDWKLFAFVGAYLGLISCLWVLALSAALGAAVGGVMLLGHRLSKGDEHEEIELAPQPGHAGLAVAGHGSRSRQHGGGLAFHHEEASTVLMEDGGANGHLGNAATEIPRDSSGNLPAHAPIAIRVPTLTAHQLKTLPFGPYISAAALVVLMLHGEIDRLARSRLYLGPAPPDGPPAAVASAPSGPALPNRPAPAATAPRPPHGAARNTTPAPSRP